MAYAPAVALFEDKHPAETVKQAVDFTRWLASGDSLTGSPTVTPDSGIVTTSPSAPAISGNAVVIWISGGTSGTTYDIEVRVSTTGGYTLVADLQITVTDPTP